jgi:hypothetical protein
VIVGVEMVCDWRDLGRSTAGESSGFSLSNAPGVSCEAENGDTGLETGLRLPLL